MTSDLLNYVYIYFYPDRPFNETVFGIHFDLQPFYVGVGRKNRFRMHLSDARNPKNDLIKHKVIRKIWNSGNKPVVRIVKEGLSREDALLLEDHLVDYFGKTIDNTGILANMIDGGTVNPVLPGTKNPMYGKRIPQESIERAKKKYQEWRLNPENKDALREMFKKISIANKSKSQSEKQAITRKRIDTLRKNKPEILQKKKAKAFRIWNTKISRVLKRATARRRLTRDEMSLLLSQKNSGSGNPMFGNGHKLAGHLNGRAKKYKLKISDFTFIIHGELCKFQAEFKKFFKTFDPLRSNKFMKKYNVSICEVPEDYITQENEIFYTDSSIFERIPNDKFEKRKNCKD